ncbi:sensor histidine kinase [Georgenia faecalis]|uniref:histidine kinase n=1 Tax=Georgenia faecalis TaxID=2483799 RepID=A0ABV9D5G6_9MICO|nr:HAMP domain-containing sensor histidine kinase [Georgenia faecalis]
MSLPAVAAAPPPTDEAPLGKGWSSSTDHRHVLGRQLPFTLVVMVVAVLLVVMAADSIELPMVFSGLLVVVAATGAAIVVPWEQLPRWWSGIVPIADISAAAVLYAGGVPASVTLVLPVLWLSTTFGVVGAVTSVSASTVALWTALLLDPTLDGSTLGRLFVVPAVLAAASVYIVLSERRAAARSYLLHRQGGLVERTLADARHQHRVLEGILNTIDVGVVAISPDGYITILNRAHAAATQGKLKIGDHVTRHAGLAGFRADRTTPLGHAGSPLVRAWRGETVSRELTWWAEDDGRWTAYRISVGQLTDDADRPAGAVIVYQDLTAEMAAVSEREDFISAVSHELRTPLTSILGYLELVIDDPEVPGEARGNLEVVERNAQRLQRLIGDLLTAGQTRRGELSIVRSTTDLADVVRDAVVSVWPRADAAGITVTARVGTGFPVAGDRARLAQVVDNLLSNAVKYSRPSGTVDVALRRDGAAIHLLVTDDGIGIAPVDQPRLFGRFFRAEAVRNGPVQGTGLGLHISRQIVEAHGGTLALESELGQGTRVRMTLPAEEDA